MLLVVIFILLCPLFGANVVYYTGSQATTKSTTQNTFMVNSTDIPITHSCLPADFYHQNYSASGVTPEVWCTNVNKRCPDWNIVVMIALKLNQNNDVLWQKIRNITNYLDQVITDCSTSSSFFLLTPQRLANEHDCEAEQTNQNGISTVMTNINPTNAVFRTTDNEAGEILTMFSSMHDCSNFTLTDAMHRAGMLMFFTDVMCDDLCVDPFVESVYNLRLIRLGKDEVEKECFNSIFKRCQDDYDDSICMTGMYDTVDQATADKNQRFCHVYDKEKSGFPTVWIIVSSVVAFLIIISCVGIRCFFRYKALKQGNKWSWFVWKSPENGAVLPEVINGKTPSAPPNDYNEVPREPDPWEIQTENLLLNEQDILGSGAFATVYLGRVKGDLPLVKMKSGTLKLGLRKDLDGTFKVAVKRLPPHASAEGRLDFHHEIEFMKELGYHPHVLSLLGVINSTHDAMIIVENCEFGDLLSFVRSRKESFSLKDPETMEDFGNHLRVKELISIAWQISDGMSYMASRNFIHRDIAARNILLTRSMVAKIGDFGLCRLVDSSLYTAKGGRLPIKWMAPESLKYYEYSLKSDVWSFGVLLWELFSLGEAPYNTIQPSEMPKYLDDGNRLPQPENTCPNEIYGLMQKCWEKKSDDRVDIDSVREELTQMLNNDSSSYGYLAIHDLDDTETCEV